MIELCVLDLDGTVLDPHQEKPVAPEVVKAVSRVLERGIQVTLATGRTLDYAAAVAKTLGLRLPLITSQGAVIGRPGQTLWQQLIDPEPARRVVEWADSCDRVVALYSHGLVYQRLELEQAQVYDHLFGGGRHRVQRFGPLFEERPLSKFIVVDEPPAETELKQLFEPDLQIVKTHQRLVEGTAAGVNKGSGLRRLLNHLQIDPGRTLVIGDNHNDLPMFEVAGLSVAMGQAESKVQEAADWIAPPVEEHGVVAALERFIP